MKCGTCTYGQINEYMMIYDNPRPRSFIDLCPRSLRFNIFKLLRLEKNIRTFKAKFRIDPPWDETVSGHMTNMASRPMYGKKSPSSEPRGR